MIRGEEGGATVTRAQGAAPAGGRNLRPSGVTVAVAVIGLVITAGVAWTAWTLNRHNEHRLLVVQTHQAAAVLGSTILSLESPLATELQIASVTGGSDAQFEQFMAPYLAPKGAFAHVSLWHESGGTLEPVATAGAAPLLDPSSSEAHQLVAQAQRQPGFVVRGLGSGRLERIAYVVADDSGYVLYAERLIPADRLVPIESDPAFANLDFATYLGPDSATADLATTDVPLDRLPLTGDVERASIPFGDTTLTLLATPQSQLGGPLGAELPWVFLVGGVLLTAATALAVELLVRRRRSAERDALTIAGLYGQLDVLYGEQRSIALTLQHALLPQYNPSIPYLETATRYVAGAHGVDIGGDWYSLLHVDDQHFAFAVGDVSGRGVSAATVMARLRFTIRAYLLEGHPPDRVLAMCSEQIDISVDDHFSTVLVGIGDRATRRLTLANAGHLNPLIMTGTEARFATTAVGLPLGITPGSYEPTTVVLRPGATFLAFTDGLVERRGESLDDGLARLVGVATRPEPTLEALVSTVLAQLTEDGSEDDIAVLAFRWAEGDLDAAPPAP